MRKTIAMLVFALSLRPVAGESRLSYLWTFDELRTKSDLVVVAEMLRTRDTHVKVWLDGITPLFPAVELHTEFSLLTSLHGTIASKTFTVRHYRTDTELLQGVAVNGPAFVDFSERPTKVYLLFLRQDYDGLYWPTSGQIDPRDSVYNLPINSLTVAPHAPIR